MERDPPIHAFVIRLWSEEDNAVSGVRVWRGVIVHAPTKRHKAVTDLEEVVAFIVACLGEEESGMEHLPSRPHDE